VVDREGAGCSMKERIGGGSVLRADWVRIHATVTGACYRDRPSATATGDPLPRLGTIRDRRSG